MKQSAGLWIYEFQRELFMSKYTNLLSEEIREKIEEYMNEEAFKETKKRREDLL